MCTTIVEVRELWRPYSARKPDNVPWEEAEVCEQCHGEICDLCRRFTRRGAAALTDKGDIITYLYGPKRFYVTIGDFSSDDWVLIEDNWVWKQNAVPSDDLKLDPLTYKQFQKSNPLVCMDVMLAFGHADQDIVDRIREAK